MAALKDMMVNGKLRVTGVLYAPTFNLDGVVVTINTSAIANVTAGNTVGQGLCTADQVKTYINNLRA